MPACAHPRGWRRWMPAALAAAAVTIGIGGILAADSAQVAQSPAVTPPSDAAEPERTPRAAVAVVGDWLAENDSRRELLNAAHRRSTVARFVSKDAAPAIADQLHDVARRLETHAAPPVTVRSTPIGYRVVSAASSRVVVETWEAVIRGALGMPPATALAHSRVTLIWEDGWRIARVAVRGASPRTMAADELAVADRAFRSFRHAP